MGVCVFLYPTPATRHGWKSVLLARAVSASVTQSVSQGLEGQSGNRGPAGRGAAWMAGDKRPVSGSSGKPKVAAVSCPSARRPREGNKCSVLPVAPFRLFPPSRSCPLRTRWPRPRNAPPPRLCSGANLRPRLFSRTCARSGAGAAVKSVGWAVQALRAQPAQPGGAGGFCARVCACVRRHQGTS